MALSQRGLAKELGVSQSWVHRRETGEVNPSADDLALMSELMFTEPGYWFTTEEDENAS